MINIVFILNDKATFYCSKCRNVRSVDAGLFEGIAPDIPITFDCSCGHSFQVVLERRGYPRKMTVLPGVYSRMDNGLEVEKGQVLILDLSLAGLRFQPHVVSAFQIGEKLRIRFQLGDPRNMEVNKMATIAHISSENQVGMTFIKKDSYSTIGAYLFE